MNSSSSEFQTSGLVLLASTLIFTICGAVIIAPMLKHQAVPSIAMSQPVQEVPDQFAASLIKHLFAYALGRDTSISDEDELAEILSKVRESKYSLRAVVQEVVASPSFRDH